MNINKQIYLTIDLLFLQFETMASIKRIGNPRGAYFGVQNRIFTNRMPLREYELF